MSVTWAATLPQRPTLDGSTETLRSSVLRTETDVGPAKVRRRYTAVADVFTVRFLMTSAQTTTFRSFFISDAKRGAEVIVMKHPVTGSNANVRITTEPVITPRGTYYEVSFGIEVLS